LSKYIVVLTNDTDIIKRLSQLIEEKSSCKLFATHSVEDSLRVMATRRCCAAIIDSDVYPDETAIEFLEKMKLVWSDMVRILLIGNMTEFDLDAIINAAEVDRVILKDWNQSQIKEVLHEAFAKNDMRNNLKKMSHIVQIQNEELASLNKVLKEKILLQTDEVMKINSQLSLSLLASVQALTHAVEAKDILTRGHSDRVAGFCLDIAGQMRLPSEQIEGIYMAAKLHDIGKIGISEQILLKPAPLTREEEEIVREHCIIGYKIVEPIPFNCNIARIILQHHEWFDGNGYPYGLKGDQISLGARILHVADAYDAMICDRPYRKSLPRAQAVDQLQAGAGKQFDPEVISVFCAFVS
jgi:response regulator RpfG family c-di-GMP phosphodiesterase